MKLRYFIFALLISAGVIFSYTSCRSNGNPTSPWSAIFTATFTISPTPLNTETSTPTLSPTAMPSSTPTNTPTYTATFTETYTPTYSPTDAFTDTPTEVPTSTPTDLPTDTPTITPTSTITPTPTRTVCVCATVQTTYTFESSTDCWAPLPANGGPESIIVNYGLSVVQAQEGSISFFTFITNDSEKRNVNLTLTYSSPQNLAGKMVAMYVWVDTDLVSTDAWDTAIQAFYTDPGWNAPWHKMNRGEDDAQWVPVTVIISGTTVETIGLQLTNIRAGGLGYIYIDNVQILDAPTPTPTVTSTPTITDTPLITSTPTATPTVTETFVPGSSCVWIISGCEALDENGSWYTGTTGVDLSINSNASYVTQGSNSLDVNFTSVAGAWNKIAIYQSFYPWQSANAVSLLVDVYVDSTLYGILNAGGWNQFTAQANLGGGIVSGNQQLVQGWQSVALPISGAPATIKDIEFILNSGGTLNGHLYLDNIRLSYSSCPGPYPPLILGWDLEGGSVGSWSLMGYNAPTGEVLAIGAPGKASNYCLDINVANGFAAADENAGAGLGFTATDASSYHGLRAWVWIDASLYGAGQAGGVLQVNCVGSTAYPASPWNNIYPNTWTQITWETTAPSFGLSDPTQLNFVQVYAQPGGTYTGNPGHVKIDDVEFY